VVFVEIIFCGKLPRPRAIALESLKALLTAEKTGMRRNRQKTPSEIDEKAGFFDGKDAILS
jgi:hypothetical protein